MILSHYLYLIKELVHLMNHLYLSRKQRNIKNLSIMNRNRIKEGLDHSQRTNKKTTIPSINIDDKHGKHALMNINFIPITNQEQEFVGSIIHFDNKTELATAQAELKQLKLENQQITERFQNARNKLHLLSQSDLSSISASSLQQILNEKDGKALHICGDESIIKHMENEQNELATNENSIPNNDPDITNKEVGLKTKIIKDEEA